MSVISDVDVTPNRLSILYQFVQERGEMGIPAQDLRAYLGPNALQRTKNPEGPREPIAEAIMREAKRLHIIQEEEGTLRVPKELRGKSSTDLQTFLDGTLLDLERAEATDQRTFPRALAWFLCQDPAHPLSFGTNYNLLVNEDCGEEVSAYGLTNQARFQNFVYWAAYLGFAWRLEVADQANFVMPDPTEALARHLRPILEDKGRLPIAEALALLAQSCPVLEGGAARREVEERLTPAKQRQPDALSKSTSLALERLEHQRLIHLHDADDAPVHLLTNRRDPRPVSHVSLAS
ncbi:MAG: hypothetical protein EXR82_07115 [Gammaproteobacteria bacterium]|nr:hypothetical protein [Gammaproteobacteria bacterium]